MIGQITQSAGHRLSIDDHSDTITHLGSVASDVGLLLDVYDTIEDILDWLPDCPGAAAP